MLVLVEEINFPVLAFVHFWLSCKYLEFYSNIINKGKTFCTSPWSRKIQITGGFFRDNMEIDYMIIVFLYSNW